MQSMSTNVNKKSIQSMLKNSDAPRRKSDVLIIRHSNIKLLSLNKVKTNIYLFTPEKVIFAESKYLKHLNNNLIISLFVKDICYCLKILSEVIRSIMKVDKIMC